MVYIRFKVGEAACEESVEPLRVGRKFTLSDVVVSQLVTVRCDSAKRAPRIIAEGPPYHP